MSTSTVHIALWAPVVVQAVLIAVACWRPRLAAPAAMACSALVVVAIFIALVVANLEAALAAFVSTSVLVVGIWFPVAAFQRSPPVRQDDADDPAVRLARFLDQRRLSLAAGQVGLAARSLDRAKVVRLEPRRRSGVSGH